MRFILLLVVLLAPFGQPLHADPSQVAPEDWNRSENNSLTIYQAPTGAEVMVFRTYDKGASAAASVQDFADIMTDRADSVVRSDPSTVGALNVQDVEYVSRNVPMLGRVIGVRQNDGSVLVMAHLGPKFAAGLAQRIDAATEKMAALVLPGAAATAASQAPTPTRPNSPRTRGQTAQRVMFELKYKYGVGGAVYPTYDLVALMDGGTAAKLGSYAVDDVSVSAIRRARASDVGTWRSSGRNVQVRWSDGDTSDLKPTVGPPTALPAARHLNGTYQAVGGGGNTALGGQVLTAQVKQFTFNANGTFGQSSSKSASSGAGVGGTRSATSGRWALSGSTLTLTYGNGKVVRTSVFYSGSAKPRGKFGRYGVLWIGGEDYKRVR